MDRYLMHMKYFWFFGSVFYIHLTYVYFALILLTANLHILEIYTKHGLKLKSLVACRIREMYKWKMVKKWQLDEVCLDKLLNTIKAFSILIWDANSFLPNYEHIEQTVEDFLSFLFQFHCSGFFEETIHCERGIIYVRT